jgi:hypothetical protein
MVLQAHRHLLGRRNKGVQKVLSLLVGAGLRVLEVVQLLAVAF